MLGEQEDLVSRPYSLGSHYTEVAIHLNGVRGGKGGEEVFIKCSSPSQLLLLKASYSYSAGEHFFGGKSICICCACDSK